jgi:hypothetical protein
MEFTLLYEGPLHSAGVPREKQNIRRQLHAQLAELWRVDPVLTTAAHLGLPHGTRRGNGTVDFGDADTRTHIFDAVRLNGFGLVALATRRNRLVCELEIRFLRSSQPGDIIVSGGDIDNRLKTLFDALRMPQTDVELSNDIATTIDEPFYCLLEDDSLITRVDVATDRLLKPDVDPVDVVLHMLVRLKSLNVTFGMPYENVGRPGHPVMMRS